VLSTVKPLRFAPTRLHGLAGLTADAPKPEVGSCSRAITLDLRWEQSTRHQWGWWAVLTRTCRAVYGVPVAQTRDQQPQRPPATSASNVD